MRPRLNTVVARTRLFNLHPRVAINLHCIPTATPPFVGVPDEYGLLDARSVEVGQDIYLLGTVTHELSLPPCGRQVHSAR